MNDGGGVGRVDETTNYYYTKCGWKIVELPGSLSKEPRIRIAINVKWGRENSIQIILVCKYYPELCVEINSLWHVPIPTYIFIHK